jgi:hypothetical protein
LGGQGKRTAAAQLGTLENTAAKLRIFIAIYALDAHTNTVEKTVPRRARRPIANRPQDAILPHSRGLVFHAALVSRWLITCRPQTTMVCPTEPTE